ncbi:response regulator [Brevundimonas variabilis]|uniref:CheY-like chemotaxis protein n=1 Tax=Brevundimonas variabilis TaxID=74312 RepID=A0A7W9FCZ9_9CAUL|nr:response regulator [Brevundimonas variabilis]MBB5744941.1 CheY-like chemotaxis protein [Brevundimonas variabilis]
MYDATLNTGLDDRKPHDENVARLCALYDARLGESDAVLSAEGQDELIAMAGIFDLDTDRPAQAIWRDLRAVLVRQAPGTEARTFVTDASSSLTLMVVEDDPAMALELTEALADAGHRVIGPFHNAEAAEVSAALHTIDLALLDINLSGDGTGADLARALRDRWGVPSIFLSGDVSATAQHAALAQGIVIKPYGTADVLDAVARATRPPVEPS